ncbi:hypothetical protein COT42_07570 [Candidatus Saganbacteria bacterium CG08_land_8_20_14_0_20_45_16]|uniref:Organic solvent tolerance-like N-terminal domain-containing protein n=1 Tax=Candidatus Saganbacteria bacterium CG08_land_8_20_14_0_20_45_16 TaxID=2014293 RepID=A0A2H0XWM8_UNCSA|nr:MAG: hypothetical protein COT42_07570 [Candidatus Saganbacteria bacterium CG08_land_8_20_14_0_20_45_16]
MNLSNRVILAIALLFIGWLFSWAIFAPKEDPSNRIYQTLKQQEKQADLTFKDVTFEEIAQGIKYWQLVAESAMVNKSTQIATLKTAHGTFFKGGSPVLRFRSPAALWDMKQKEILLDKPIGYDLSLEDKVNTLLKNIKQRSISSFTLPPNYLNGHGYWFAANNLSWKVATQQLLCTGQIILNKGEVTGLAERLESDVALEHILLSNNAKVIIKLVDSFPVTQEAAVFEIISRQNLIKARGQPVLYWGKAKVTATNFSFSQREETLKLDGNVTINYGDIWAFGQTGLYSLKTEEIILNGNAQAKQAENKLQGNAIKVSLKNNSLAVIGKGKVVINEGNLK